MIQTVSTVAGPAEGPTTPTLVGPEVAPLMVKLLYSERLGWTNNFYTKGLFRWSDQSDPPSAAPESAISGPVDQLKACGIHLRMRFGYDKIFCLSKSNGSF